MPHNGEYTFYKIHDVGWCICCTLYQLGFLSSKVRVQICTSTTSILGFLFIHILANTLHYQISTFVYLIGVKNLSIFDVLMAHSSPFCELSICILSPFPKFFLLLICRKTFYILGINHLSIMYCQELNGARRVS